MSVSKNINKYKWIYLEISTKRNSEFFIFQMKNSEIMHLRNMSETANLRRPLLDNSAKGI